MEGWDGEDFEVELGENEVIWVFEVDGFCEEWLVIWFCKLMLFQLQRRKMQPKHKKTVRYARTHSYHRCTCPRHTLPTIITTQQQKMPALTA